MTIRIAGLNVGISNSFKHIEWLVRDYLTDGSPDFTVSATREEIEEERLHSEPGFSDGYLESTVIYRKIAERLPEYDAFVFHGAVISVDGRAYAFTARSGVGKTTHTRLFINALDGRADYINGDKPIIRFKDGVPYACGTPWMGKEGYGRNVDMPLLGIALLGRGEENFAEAVAPDEAASTLLSQMYVPKTGGGASRLLLLLGRLISSVRIIRVRCNMNPDAPIVSARAFGIEGI